MTMTELEREEARYEIWVMSGGREKAQMEHDAAVDADILVLEAEGWKVLSDDSVRESCDEYNRRELVIRKDRELMLIHSLRNTWMESCPSGGWGLWRKFAAVTN